MEDIYVYDGTNVLINKRNIRSNKELDQFENAMTSLAIININRNFEFKDLNDIYEIHRALFENVYDWAGDTRKINIYKEEPILAGLSVQYEDYKKIKISVTNLNKKFLNTKWEELSKSEIIDNIVRFFSALWQIHPFREGNTRSVSTLMFLFIKKMKLKLNQDFIKEHAKYFRNALVLASIGEYSEYEHITDFLKDAISFKIIDSEKYKTIKNYELDKYQYNYHNYKKDWFLVLLIVLLGLGVIMVIAPFITGAVVLPWTIIGLLGLSGSGTLFTFLPSKIQQHWCDSVLFL